MQAKTIEVIDLPKILDKRGNLSIVEEFKNIPFKIERVYWIYDVPGGYVEDMHIRKVRNLLLLFLVVLMLFLIIRNVYASIL